MCLKTKARFDISLDNDTAPSDLPSITGRVRMEPVDEGAKWQRAGNKWRGYRSTEEGHMELLSRVRCNRKIYDRVLLPIL
jgi:hypothetical protein